MDRHEIDEAAGIARQWVKQGRIKVQPAEVLVEVPSKSHQNRREECVGIHLQESTIETVQRLPEPFNRFDLMNALGVSLPSVGNTIRFWKQLGWINSSSWGNYRRTPQFGQKAD